MSLRTDYSSAINAAFEAARSAGYDFIKSGSNIVAISTAMTTAANQGKKEFTYTASATFQPDDLRLEGPLWNAYKSGITQGLIEEQLTLSEFTMALNTSEQTSTKIDLTFSF